MRETMVKALIERFCGTQVTITDMYAENGNIRCSADRADFPERVFFYSVNIKKRKVHSASTACRDEVKLKAALMYGIYQELKRVKGDERTPYVDASKEIAALQQDRPLQSKKND